MGLPTANVLTGGHDAHSEREWICVEDIGLAAATLVELAKVCSRAQDRVEPGLERAEKTVDHPLDDEIDGCGVDPTHEDVDNVMLGRVDEARRHRHGIERTRMAPAARIRVTRKSAIRNVNTACSDGTDATGLSYRVPSPQRIRADRRYVRADRPDQALDGADDVAALRSEPRRIEPDRARGEASDEGQHLDIRGKAPEESPRTPPQHNQHRGRPEEVTDVDEPGR